MLQLVKSQEHFMVYWIVGGWMVKLLFHRFHNHFLRYTPPSHPLLLMMGGHSSHYFPDTIQLSKVWFCTHYPQTPPTSPTKVNCFGPLKTHWLRACHEYMTQHPGKDSPSIPFSVRREHHSGRLEYTLWTDWSCYQGRGGEICCSLSCQVHKNSFCGHLSESCLFYSFQDACR